MLTVKLFYFVLAIVAALKIICVRCDEFKIIESSAGAIRGAKQTTDYKKVDYYSFKGIPYAEAPIGDLRFKAPKPKKSWTPKVLDALEFGSICYQLGELFPSTYPQSEDCLFLNIYVPADVNENDEKLPVLFFIHGGGYTAGSGNDDFYGPDFFIEKRTVLVTSNYRLGVFGFLSLSLPEYSGNMGLKDQQLALKWIHKNIEHFGGDNEKITVFGQSAGGASTHFQILSSESRKYFQNAIPMSGVASNYWAMTEHNDHIECARKLAGSAGKSTNHSKELLKYLLSESAEYLTENGFDFSEVDRSMSLLFTPVIERSDAVQPFITKTIEEMYGTEDVDVNVMFTYTSAEMLMLLSPKMLNIKELNSNFSILLPFKSLKLSPDSEKYRAINDEIRRFYFGNGVINMDKSPQYIDLLSDMNFGYAIEKMAKLHAVKAKGKSFYVRFDVDSKLNIMKRSRTNPFQHPGAAHCDDLCYLFKFGIGKPFYDDVFSSPDDKQSMISLQTIEHMTDLFTKFATNDHSCSACSGLGFLPIQNGEVNFLDITNDGIRPGLDPNAKAMEFWANIEKRMQKYIDVKGDIEHEEL